MITYDEIEIGDDLPPLTVALDRSDLIRYAGAGGDFNPIHWNERVATAAGLPNVIAHGMLTMGLGTRLVSDWLGDPGAITGYRARFTQPVAVPDPDGASIEYSGRIVAKRDGLIEIEILATVGGHPERVTVARATVTAAVATA